MFRWLRPDWRGCLTRSWPDDHWLPRDMTVARHQTFDRLEARLDRRRRRHTYTPPRSTP